MIAILNKQTSIYCGFKLLVIIKLSLSSFRLCVCIHFLLSLTQAKLSNRVQHQILQSHRDITARKLQSIFISLACKMIHKYSMHTCNIFTNRKFCFPWILVWMSCSNPLQELGSLSQASSGLRQTNLAFRWMQFPVPARACLLNTFKSHTFRIRINWSY